MLDVYPESALVLFQDPVLCHVAWEQPADGMFVLKQTASASPLANGNAPDQT